MEFIIKSVVGLTHSVPLFDADTVGNSRMTANVIPAGEMQLSLVTVNQ